MPHFGLMSTADSFNTEAGALLRARLHIRSGKRRLRQGKISAGIVTISDAVSFAMRWYISSPGRMEKLLVKDDENLNDDKTVFEILKRSGVKDPSFEYAAFDRLVDRALVDEMTSFDCSDMLRSVESFMVLLGVMPFDEEELPPEDPSTF